MPFGTGPLWQDQVEQKGQVDLDRIGQDWTRWGASRPSDRISLSAKSWWVTFLSMTGLAVTGRIHIKLSNHLLFVLCEFVLTDLT